MNCALMDDSTLRQQGFRIKDALHAYMLLVALFPSPKTHLHD